MANKKPKNSLWVSIPDLMSLSVMKDRFYKDKIHKALKVGDKEEAKRQKKLGDEFDKWVKALEKLPDDTQMWELDKKDIELFGDDVYRLPSASWAEELWTEPESFPVPFSVSLSRATPEERQRWLTNT